MHTFLLKLTFIQGLKDVVLAELEQYPEFQVHEAGREAIYLDFSEDFQKLRALRSVTNIYIVRGGVELNPHAISNRKSILGEMIALVVGHPARGDRFATFKLSCAGPDSKEVREIKTYVAMTYKLVAADEADLELYIGKIAGSWEVGVRVTPRPLTLRDYRVENIKGGLNPTIAYAMNSFCDLDTAQSYLNIFSGSATLLIEAGLSKRDMKMCGFDHDGKSNALAVKNIKKAGLIKHIQLKTADIFDRPDLGTFDVIVSDLPFGMQVSKHEDLEKLYRWFVEYCEEFLNQAGTMVVYTTAHTLLQPMLEDSQFAVIKTLDLKVSTVVGAYIHPKIFVCKFK